MTLNHVFYLLPSFVETLSSIPLRKQVWKTKGKKKKTKQNNQTKNQTKTKHLFPSATNMVFASLFLIIIVFKNQADSLKKTMGDGSS